MALVVKVLKYGILGVAVGLWGYGLADQMHSLDMTARYVALSAAMVAVVMA